MNLAKNPTKDQLRQLLASCDDEAGHHIAWADYSGEVHITRLPDDMLPAGWEMDMGGRVKFRLETFAAGNGYVGKEASESEQWVTEFFNDLQEAWREDRIGSIYY